MTDKNNLEHVKWSRAEQLFIRPFFPVLIKQQEATSEVYINNLHQITIENNMLLHKSVITIISDNGPDWSTDYTVNIYNLRRFWEELQLDTLIWITYTS